MKFQVDVRKVSTQSDITILNTENFREAVAEYDRLTEKMEEQTTACDYDIVIMYVKTDNHCNPDDNVPVVMSMLDIRVVES